MYQFVRQNTPSHHVKEHNEDSLPSVSSPANDLDCKLRNGDCVVKFFSFNLACSYIIYFFSI